MPSLLPAPALSAGPHPTAAPVAHREEAAPPPACAHAMKVTVAENSPARVVDLDAVFAGMSGIQHDTGLHLAMLGNTNSRLVATDLSGADLTLSFARWKSGTATITVGATDADGVSVREVLLVTVFPRGAAAPGTTTHTPAAARPSTPATP